MFRNIVLVISLLANAYVAQLVFGGTSSNAPRMTCEQARGEKESKRALESFAERNGSSLAKLHDYLKNSDYSLRNLHFSEGKVTFVYAANFYPSSCGIHWPGLDGNIVRIATDVEIDPKATFIH